VETRVVSIPRIVVVTVTQVVELTVLKMVVKIVVVTVEASGRSRKPEAEPNGMKRAIEIKSSERSVRLLVTMKCFTSNTRH
jgi:hypothetical protein